MTSPNLAGLIAALRQIRDDDLAPSHPCGPQLYGYFGSIADAALRTVSDEPGAGHLTGPHATHVTRDSDASSFDTICINCGAKDVSGGGWGKLVDPCPAIPADTQSREGEKP